MLLPLHLNLEAAPASGFNGVLFKDARFNTRGEHFAVMSDNAFCWSGMTNSLLVGSTLIKGVRGYKAIFIQG